MCADAIRAGRRSRRLHRPARSASNGPDGGAPRAAPARPENTGPAPAAVRSSRCTPTPGRLPFRPAAGRDAPCPPRQRQRHSFAHSGSSAMRVVSCRSMPHSRQTRSRSSPDSGVVSSSSSYESVISGPMRRGEKIDFLQAVCGGVRRQAETDARRVRAMRRISPLCGQARSCRVFSRRNGGTRTRGLAAPSRARCQLRHIPKPSPSSPGAEAPMG